MNHLSNIINAFHVLLTSFSFNLLSQFFYQIKFFLQRQNWKKINLILSVYMHFERVHYELIQFNQMWFFVLLFILKYECHTTSHSYFIIYNQMLLIIIITVTHHHHHRCSSNKYRRWLIADWESESSFLLNA